MFSNLYDIVSESPTYQEIDKTLSFSDYIAHCRHHIEKRRQDLNTPANAKRIIDANSPFELRPSQSKAKYGVLFIHGLFDSPFTFREIANLLHAQGILCRSILLPGHGTKPDDLLNVTYHDWLKAAKYGIESFEKEADQLFLVGYSTGAALSLYHALHYEHISGLVLLAPAIQIKPPVRALLTCHQIARWICIKNPWVCQVEEIDYTKYRSIALNPVAQVNSLAAVIQDKYQHAILPTPLLMILSADDETISSQAAMAFFAQLKHERNRMLLYSSVKRNDKNKNIISRLSHYPDKRIEHLSHVGMPYSSLNEHYGENGDYLYASHANEVEVTFGAYNRIDENTHDWLLKVGMTKKQRRPLTYNPDFHYMADTIKEFILAS